MRLVLAAGLALAISGCASVQTANPEKTAAVKKLETKPDLGQVYICRDGSMFGMAIHPDIVLDGKTIGSIARNSFIYAEVAPGDHSVNVKSLEHDSVIPFKVAAGEQKYLQAWISIGVVAGRGIIDFMDPAVAKECIAKGDLVEAAN